MHELSLVRSLIRQVESILDDEGGKAVEIEVAIGPLSGVEPLLVQSAFQQLAPKTQLADAVLRIEQPKLLARCRDCQCEFEIHGFLFECPTCQSRRVDVTSGDAFRLISVSVEEDLPAEYPLQLNDPS
jgi:hydrogenase nickel incorporation protein HypA/HybF